MKRRSTVGLFILLGGSASVAAIAAPPPMVLSRVPNFKANAR